MIARVEEKRATAEQRDQEEKEGKEKRRAERMRLKQVRCEHDILSGGFSSRTYP